MIMRIRGSSLGKLPEKTVLSDGGDGDSLFSNVDYTSSVDYVIFTLSNGTQIKIPTWTAFEALQTLCNQMNTNISSLQTIINALQDNDYVKSVTPVMQDGKEIGYTITFSKSNPITIYHGKDGSDGADGADGEDGSDGNDGSTPVIGVRQETDGIYYWTLNGEWLTDSQGNKIKAQGIDGSDGSDGVDGDNGKDGITPKFKIENGLNLRLRMGIGTFRMIMKALGCNLEKLPEKTALMAVMETRCSKA